MVVHKRNGIAWPEFEDGAIKYLPQVVSRTRFAGIMEIVVKRDVEECDLVLKHEATGMNAALGDAQGEEPLTRPSNTRIYGLMSSSLEECQLSGGRHTHRILTPRTNTRRQRRGHPSQVSHGRA